MHFYKQAFLYICYFLLTIQHGLFSCIVIEHKYSNKTNIESISSVIAQKLKWNARLVFHNTPTFNIKYLLEICILFSQEKCLSVLSKYVDLLRYGGNKKTLIIFIWHKGISVCFVPNSSATHWCWCHVIRLYFKCREMV